MDSDLINYLLGGGVAVVVAAWFWIRSKRKPDNSNADRVIGHLNDGGVGDPLSDRAAESTGGLKNALSKEEPDVPTLSAADQPAAAPASVITEEEKTEAPANNIVAEEVTVTDEINPATATSDGRHAADIDPAVEAVVHFTPRRGTFNLTSISQIPAFIKEVDLTDRVKVDYFDTTTRRWYHSASKITECGEIYLSMLLANRVRHVDELIAARFIGLADRMAITFDADADIPDSVAMIGGAERVSRILTYFDKTLTVKIGSAADIDKNALNTAAVGCGFVASNGRFEKRVTGSTEPVMIIEPSKTLPNEAELTLDVPLASAANDPLGEFFAVANDLCCRIDAVMTDISGRPIDSIAASMIGHELKENYRVMADHGVPAGSPRARRIYARS